MNIFLRMTLIFVVFTTVLFSQVSSFLTEEEKIYLKNKPIITFKIRKDRAPFEFIKESKPQGIAVEYIQRIGEIVGFTPKFVALDMTPKEFFAELESENPRYDTLAYSVKSPKRAERFHFGSAFMSYPVMIISNKSVDFISSTKDLRGKVVAIESGFLTNKWLKRDFPSINIINKKTTKEALALVNSGEADAYVGNLAIANYLMLYENLENLKVAAPTEYKNVTYSFIAPKSQPELASILSKGYKRIPQEEHTAIQQKWLSIQFVEKIDYSLLIDVLIVVGFIILWILWWNRSLHKKIEEGVLEYKKQQELLIQQSKMAAMGEMIGAIAHQWKQPINAMSLNIEYLQNMYELGGLNKEMMDKRCGMLNDNISFMSQTISDFRSFFKPNKKKKLFSINRSIEKVVNILQSQLKTKGVEVILPKESVEIESIPNELEQVILNIVNNGKDILLEKEAQNPTITIDLKKEEGRVILEILDNGGGIEPENLDKIFNSYFSTKGEKGTGIGLYMSKLIVENSLGGKIEAENYEQGAKFSIILPCSI